ncbi:hypothetical protein Tco_0504564 [Tanacetum coccineum]
MLIVDCHINKWVPLAAMAATSAMTWQVGPTYATWRWLSNDSLPRGNSNMTGVQVPGMRFGSRCNDWLSVRAGNDEVRDPRQSCGY